MPRGSRVDASPNGRSSSARPCSRSCGVRRSACCASRPATPGPTSGSCRSSTRPARFRVSAGTTSTSSACSCPSSPGSMCSASGPCSWPCSPACSACWRSVRPATSVACSRPGAACSSSPPSPGSADSSARRRRSSSTSTRSPGQRLRSPAPCGSSLGPVRPSVRPPRRALDGRRARSPKPASSSPPCSRSPCASRRRCFPWPWRGTSGTRATREGGCSPSSARGRSARSASSATAPGSIPAARCSTGSASVRRLSPSSRCRCTSASPWPRSPCSAAAGGRWSAHDSGERAARPSHSESWR